VRVAGGLVRRLVAVVMVGTFVVMHHRIVVQAHACGDARDRLDRNRQRQEQRDQKARRASAHLRGFYLTIYFESPGAVSSFAWKPSS
jgi:hypothetical protein